MTGKPTPKPQACKRKYRDDIAAKLALAKIQRVDNPRRDSRERRAYKCNVCRWWHLTSQELEEDR